MPLTNKQNNIKMVKGQQTPYVSPHTEIVGIKSLAIICQSGNINNFNMRDDDTVNWLQIQEG